MAIQVNGTTVIDNSRNLTNIASVDATTAAAIGAAGVGGGVWSLESTTTISSTVSSVSGIVIPSSGDMVMVTLENMVYGNPSNYYNTMIRLSTNGGSSYYSTSGDYKRYDGTNRDGLIYRESAQGTSSSYQSYSGILLQGLSSGQYLAAAHMWGIQYSNSTAQMAAYFESGGIYQGYRFEATTSRPDRLQLAANFSNSFVSGTIRIYSYNA